MRLRIALLALSALLPLAPGVQAQSATTQAAAASRPAPDEATRAAARQLGERLNFTGQAQAIIASVRNQVAITFARASGKSPEEAGRGVDEVIMPDYTAAAPELVGLITDAWASTFTAEELRELQRFYATPLGTKLQHSGGAMNQLVAASSRTWAQGILQRSLQAHDADLRARGLKN
jgi:hypothetical protein